MEGAVSVLVIGITGGIGSGKSAVTDYFEQKGIVIADADKAARIVVEPGQPALRSIAEHFGNHLILEDGYLNRRALRDIIFNNPDERRWLEQLTHPLVNQQLTLELQQATSPYAILVSPLLFEARQKYMVNRILIVDADKETQLLRTMNRDSISREQAEAILHSQASRAQRLAIADDVVDNTGSLEMLHLQLDALHQLYLNLAA